jgi:hypothetical protein
MSWDKNEISVSVETVLTEWWVVKKEDDRRRMVQMQLLRCEGDGRVGRWKRSDWRIEREER